MERGRNVPVRFDFAIGNPPYQEETPDNRGARPVYNMFMDAAYQIADKTELITPARFLFNAGKTPKGWNAKMLHDRHFKVLDYKPDSSEVFPNADIRGGVAITYYDNTAEGEAIGLYIPDTTLKSIAGKVMDSKGFESFSDIVSTGHEYVFSDTMRKEHPEAIESLGTTGLRSYVFTTPSSVFFDEEPDDGHEYIRILGLEDKKRVFKWIRRDYVKPNDRLDKWKVLVPAANGSGAIGEKLSTPLIGAPLIGQTRSFLSIGSFENENEAEACLKYVKSRFLRCMLGVLKVTQNNPRDTWACIPMQDFTSHSDIHWNASIANIDSQLYRKYDLSDGEIEFITKNIKEME